MPNNFTVRAMHREELALALAWATREGWNPGLDDAESFYCADPNGFFVGCLDGKPIGSIAAVKYSHHFGFLGLYIVLPEHRGQGYGQQLWRAAMHYLGPALVGLDGVVEQQENYKKSGFIGSHQNIRYAGKGRPSTAPCDRIIDVARRSPSIVNGYDRRFFPANRMHFIDRWIRQPHTTALGLVDNRQQLVGYGAIRQCHSGYKIGPLFATDSGGAEELYLALSAQAADQAVFLDVPALNPAARALAEKYSMAPVFETARMYSGAAPDLPWAEIFGITSFELG